MAQIVVAVVLLAAGVYKGQQAKKLKEQEAKGLREAATRRMAITTREMQEEIRNKELMHSRAIVVAGLSGAGTDGLTKMLGDLNAEGEYRVLSVLWNGQNEAEGLTFRAEAAEREGKAAEKAGWIDGITSAVSGYSGMGGGGAKAAAGGGATANTAPGTMYSPVPGSANQLWSAPGTIPSAGLYSPVKPRALWGS